MQIKIEIDKKKLEAVKCCMPDETDAEKEIIAAAQTAAEDTVSKLYNRYVPKAVKIYLTKSEEIKKKPPEKKNSDGVFSKSGENS